MGYHLHAIRSTHLSIEAVIRRAFNGVGHVNMEIRKNPLGQEARKEDEGFHDELMCVQIVETEQRDESARRGKTS